MTPSSPASPARGPAVAVASPARNTAAGRPLRSGIEGDVQGQAARGLRWRWPRWPRRATHLRGQPRPFSLSKWSLGSAGLSEAMWACDLWVMGAGSPLGTLFNEELSPPLVKSGQCQEVGDAGAAGGAGGLQARPAF